MISNGMLQGGRKLQQVSYTIVRYSLSCMNKLCWVLYTLVTTWIEITTQELHSLSCYLTTLSIA